MPALIGWQMEPTNGIADFSSRSRSSPWTPTRPAAVRSATASLHEDYWPNLVVPPNRPMPSQKHRVLTGLKVHRASHWGLQSLWFARSQASAWPTAGLKIPLLKAVLQVKARRSRNPRLQTPQPTATTPGSESSQVTNFVIISLFSQIWSGVVLLNLLNFTQIL